MFCVTATQTAKWGDVVCLSEEDIDSAALPEPGETNFANRGVNITYTINNIGRYRARGVPGWRHLISIDGCAPAPVALKCFVLGFQHFRVSSF
eukprot:9111770-Pyramimonas_sp.AAC.1